MNSSIALWLVQDGITNGAIYALLALALLLVFAVTRVIRAHSIRYAMFIFFSNRLGCAGSLLVSAIVTGILLLLLGVIELG